MERSDKVYQCGDRSVRLLGIIELILETLEHLPDISVLMDVVSINLPVLIDLYVLDSNSLLPDNVTKRL